MSEAAPGAADPVGPPEPAAASVPVRRHRSRLRLGVRCDTSVALRGMAIVLVLLAHLQVWPVRGGAHLLLALAGFTFARFGLNTVRATDRVAGLAGSILRLALPALVFIAGMVAFADGYGPANLVLLNHYLGPSVWTAAWNFWFIEALVEIMVAALLLFSFPGVRRFERRHPLLLPALVLALGLVTRYDPFGWFTTTLQFGRPHLIFWLFALGWLVQRSTTTPARLLASVVTLVTLTDYFPDEPLREMVIQAGLLALVWLPSLRLPALLAATLHRVAAASLWVYLTHWLTWPWLVLTARLPWPLVVVCCLLVGMAAQLSADAATRRLQPLLRGVLVRQDRPGRTAVRTGRSPVTSR